MNVISTLLFFTNASFSNIGFSIILFTHQRVTTKIYTQVTSSYRIQNIVTTASSRKATKRNSCLFPSCVTQKSAL
ncbi:hypothetical protein CTM94_15920 [Photobacterium leiognathi]|uniref:Secreted protein n=1 Tax=Photobacterium leiognathi TaxID=553611 RepID=A0ABX5GCZ3_PHOLE|nr:hypothetical protein CTM94_15920 [Photobacterium leiognathi]